MNVAIAWPNMWLSGSRFRNRNGKNGLPYFRYFRTSRSTGTMFASTLRWVMTTPFGSAVAPDVKMISATSSRVTATGVNGAVAFQSISLQLPDERCRVAFRRRRRQSPVDLVASTSSPSSSSFAPTMRATLDRKSGGRAIVDRHGDRCRSAGSPRTR